MRRRLRNFLPIVLIALTVQIFAPIAATWAAGFASDPLNAAAICSGGGDSTTEHSGQSGQHRAHDGCCSVCSVLHTGASVDTPQSSIATLYRHAERVVWLEAVPGLFGMRAGSHAQARAPPSIS